MNYGKKHRARIGLIESERIQVRIRSHWVSLIPGVFLSLTLGAGAVFALFYSVDLMLFLALLSLAMFIRTIIFWYYHVYHVTNRRIFLFRLLSGFRFKIDEVIFDLVKQVGVKRPSFFSTLFNYGHIVIGKKRGESLFFMRWIAHPQQVFRDINQALNQIIIIND